MSEGSSSRRNTLLVGAVLILAGLVFLVRNLFGFTLWRWNWWALFILIPAVAALAAAWRTYERNGRRPSAAMRGPLVGGLILLLVAVILLFNLNWGLMWPLFIVIIGVGILLFQ